MVMVDNIEVECGRQADKTNEKVKFAALLYIYILFLWQSQLLIQ